MLEKNKNHSEQSSEKKQKQNPQFGEFHGATNNKQSIMLAPHIMLQQKQNIRKKNYINR